MRCLLFSPVAPPDPANGDAVYTEDLLHSPPPGIEYVRYTDALASGELEWGPSVREPRSLRSSPGALPAALARLALHSARRAELLLPDPVRWLRVRGSFDVVHVHCMPVRFMGPRPPVLLTDSAGTFWYWTAGRGLPEQRVERLLRREGRVARLLGYLHPTANPAQERIAFWVESGIRLARHIGVDVARASVCPAGVPSAQHPRQSPSETLLFVGRAWDYKGGPDALRIFELVRRQLSQARLIVAGPDRPTVGAPEGVEWLGPVDRATLYASVYPRANVFLYPTRFDAAPLVVQEALANGLPVVAPRDFGIPDLVKHGETGYLLSPWDVEEAATVVLALLRDEAEQARIRAAALADFEARLSASRRNAVLGALYQAVTT